MRGTGCCRDAGVRLLANNTLTHFVMRASLHIAFVASFLLGPALALAQQRAPETHHGFSILRLARIDSLMQRAVNRGEIAGAVALVRQDGRTVYERAVGWSDKAASRPMRVDDIFRIASQTKALTSVGIMSLVEEGKLELNDPVSRYIPAYERTTVVTQSDTGRVVRPARRQITIRDLLTHTAGISYGTDSLVSAAYAGASLGPAAGWGWYTADKDEPVCTTMERLATLPFVAQPGERFVYGYSTDILGCVIERVSGMSVDAFLRTRIIEPLGMRDTYFFLPADKRGRLAVVYASTGDSTIARAPDGARGQGHYVDGPRRNFSGGAGLVSTAADYGRFLQMLLNGGSLDGVRILAPSTVALMTSNQTGTLFSQTGEGFGLGFSILERAGANGRVESPGTYGWGGAYASSYGVDPQERLVLVFLMQQLPNRSRVGARFPMLVYQALVEAR